MRFKSQFILLLITGLKFYYHFGNRRLQPCLLPIPTRLQEHPKPGAGCDRATPLGKAFLPGRLGVRVNGGISILVLTALVVPASFSRSFSGLTGRDLIFLGVTGWFRKEKLHLSPCGPAPDIRLSYNSLSTWGSVLCGSQPRTLPPRPSAGRGSLISLCVVSGEVLGCSSDSSDSNVEFNFIVLQFISRESDETSKYSSSSAIASADEFEISKIIL